MMVGILLPFSSNNSIKNNVASSCYFKGILLEYSSDNNIIENNIASNSIGESGIYLSLSEKNILKNNIVKSNNVYGICISWADDNTLDNNIISSNNFLGIYLSYFSMNTTLYHNNIIDNSVFDKNNQVQAEWEMLCSNNWYHPDLLDGNYWSDYNGSDINGDGMGDTKIPHPDIDYDNYPFINKSGWLTFLLSPEYWDFGTVYQEELIQKTFKIQNAFVYNKGRDDLNIQSITSEPEISISGIELPVKIPKGYSKTFNVTIDTTNLEGHTLRSLEINSNDEITPNKTILIYGIVKPPIHDVRIKNIDFQSRIIKGQISLFNITVENRGDFREKNLTIEIREGEKIRDNATIEHIDCKESKSAIVKWDSENTSLGIHDITIAVLNNDKESLTDLTAKVSVLAPSKAKTLIVTNLERLEGVENKLIQLSHHPSVNGIILNVANDQNCSEAYNSWDSNPTSENANDVARAIKDLIDSSLEVYKNIEYIIIAGDDEVIPFYRIQDKSLESYVGSYGLYDERDYIERYGQLKPATTIGSAFQDNMYLTDDFYADFESEDLPEGFLGELYIPDKPVGRLVETPGEISKTIDVFSKKGDIVNPNRIFITSYDFMNDTGGSCTSVWSDLSTPNFMGKGIEEPGTYNDATEVITALLNGNNDIVAIFQHADHSGFDIERLHDFATSNIISNSSADLNGSIVYSMSCHAGLNVPEDEKFNYDLAQAFMGKGVLAYVAPTGWGIGGVVTEAGHERLLHYFTTHLCEGIYAGTALMRAKQDYYAFDFDFDYIDQKVVLTAILYGLPVYGVNVEAKTEGIMEALSMEKPCNTFTFRPDYSEIETPVGNYSSADETLSAPGKPVLPKLIWPYTMGNKMLHGITLTNASYDIIESTSLPYEEIVVSIAGGYLQPGLAGEDWNPSKFFKVSTIGKRQYIILITGQFKRTGMMIKGGKRVNMGDLRRYTELTFDLYLSSPEAEKEPSAIKVNPINESFINVNATDESGIRKIVVAYTDNKGKWGSIDIVPDVAACALEEEIELEAGKEYFVQAVDIYGNVAIDDNDGEYYLEKGGGLGPS
jgi:parallel beta-helix repeat protein